jgi:hypothetical protein
MSGSYVKWVGKLPPILFWENFHQTKAKACVPYKPPPPSSSRACPVTSTFPSSSGSPLASTAIHPSCPPVTHDRGCSPATPPFAATPPPPTSSMGDGDKSPNPNLNHRTVDNNPLPPCTAAGSATISSSPLKSELPTKSQSKRELPRGRSHGRVSVLFSRVRTFQI